jgi:hypothetical protein
MEGLRKTMKNLSQDSWPPGQDLSSGPVEYKKVNLLSITVNM